MYGKNTLDKIYLTQKKLLPHPSTSQRGENSHPSPILLPPKGETLHPFKGKLLYPLKLKGELLYPLKLKGELQFAPTDPCSLLTVLCSLTPALCSLTPAHCSLFSVH
ncbi:hypothetical protein [Capnocytophaga gingivalis]|uniref:hypothetical protein n=1 Tax=Capnocytophaga gingivalis TaxID=1017 RepID=UPI002353E3BF|nr:hypothetical protein [Capnocytophaga gingivalis]